MSDALMTELTPMEHSQNIVAAVLSAFWAGLYPAACPANYLAAPRKTALPTKKALPFPGSAPVIIVISVYIVNWIAQKAA